MAGSHRDIFRQNNSSTIRLKKEHTDSTKNHKNLYFPKKNKFFLRNIFVEYNLSTSHLRQICYRFLLIEEASFFEEKHNFNQKTCS